MAPALGKQYRQFRSLTTSSGFRVRTEGLSSRGPFSFKTSRSLSSAMLRVKSQLRKRKAVARQNRFCKNAKVACFFVSSAVVATRYLVERLHNTMQYGSCFLLTCPVISSRFSRNAVRQGTVQHGMFCPAFLGNFLAVKTRYWVFGGKP